MANVNLVTAAANGTTGFTNALGVGGGFSLIVGASEVGAPGTANDVVLKFTASMASGSPDLSVAVATPDLFVLRNASLGTASSLVTLTSSTSNGGTLSSFTTSNPATLTASGIPQSIPNSPGTINSTISLLNTGTNLTALGATVTYVTTPGDATPANNVATVNVRIGDAPLHATNSSTSFGSALIAATASNPVAANATYNDLSSSTTIGAQTGTSVPALGTTATILNYVNTTAGDTGLVSMAWRSRTANEASNISGLNDFGNTTIGYLVSDVVNLTGMTDSVVPVGPNGYAVNKTDTFVLQMSYNELLLNGHEAAGVIHGNIYVASRDGNGAWINAVLDNIGGTPNYVGVGNYNPLTNVLGDYGINPTTNTVWAVLNHNSEFAVIPEPSTLVLGGLALLGFAGVGLRRRRMAKTQSV